MEKLFLHNASLSALVTSGAVLLDFSALLVYNQGGRGKAPGSPFWCGVAGLWSVPLLFLCLDLAVPHDLCGGLGVLARPENALLYDFRRLRFSPVSCVLVAS